MPQRSSAGACSTVELISEWEFRLATLGVSREKCNANVYVTDASLFMDLAIYQESPVCQFFEAQESEEKQEKLHVSYAYRVWPRRCDEARTTSEGCNARCRGGLELLSFNSRNKVFAARTPMRLL
jgi:hypothetical protein